MAEEFGATSNDVPVKQAADLFEGWSFSVIPAGREIIIPAGRHMTVGEPVDIEPGAVLDGDVFEF